MEWKKPRAAVAEISNRCPLPDAGIDFKRVNLPSFLRLQLMRASSSVSLNLAEGSARRSDKDRRRFYNIALASLREVQAILDLEQIEHLKALADQVGAHIYRLSKN